MICKTRIMVGYVTTDDSCGILNLMLIATRTCLGCKVDIPNTGRVFLCMSKSFISRLGSVITSCNIFLFEAPSNRLRLIFAVCSQLECLCKLDVKGLQQSTQ